jgi:hypothetical protein
MQRTYLVFYQKNIDKFLIEDPCIIVVRSALRNDPESYAGGSLGSW